MNPAPSLYPQNIFCLLKLILSLIGLVELLNTKRYEIEQGEGAG